MSFQKCPICVNGKVMADNFVTWACTKECPVCKGTQLINIKTGLPPNKNKLVEKI